MSVNKKNLEIEYLRAIAIGMTLLSHLPILLPFHMNFFNSFFALYMPWSGVDLFFCISGYIVSKAYVESLDDYRRQGEFWLAAQCFWIRRMYRLLPTAWLWILVPLVLSIVFNDAGLFQTWQTQLRSLTAVMTFSGNIANQYGMTLGPNSVYWSLALEEQFYFIFPLFLLFVTTARYRVVILLVLIGLQFPLDRNMLGEHGVLTSFRLDAIMWGVLIYIFSRSKIYRQYEPTFLRMSPIKIIGVNILLIYLLGAIPGQMIQTPIAVGLIAIVSALLVFMASFNSGYIFAAPLISPILRWMGSRSYGMYVIHFTAYRLSIEVWQRYDPVRWQEYNGGLTAELLLTATFFIVILSELNYQFIEQPLRKKGAVIASQRLALP